MKLSTHLYNIEIPNIFEKTLQMGQLLRCERMDRYPQEESFCELNFWVGLVSEEMPELDSNIEPIEALWQRFLSKEQALGTIDETENIELQRTESTLRAKLKLPSASWRPISGQLQVLTLFKIEGDAIFSRFCLEYDWAFENEYLALAEGMLTSLAWHSKHLNDSGLQVQSQQVFSSFDKMEASQKDAIVKRYMGHLGQLPPEPAEFEAPVLLNLKDSASATIDLQLLQSSVRRTGPYEQGFLMRIDSFEQTISVNFLEQDITQTELDLLSDLVKLSSAQLKKASELLWQHCQICFEATDYGAGDESNEEYFSIHGPEDALRECGEISISFDEDNRSLENRVCALDFYPVWEDEHGCSLILRNGRFVAWTEQCSGLEQFDHVHP